MIPKVLRRKPKKPLEVNLTLRFNYGEQNTDSITVINDKKIPMVGSVFESRDRILRAFTRQLFASGLAQPKVMSELFPALRLLKRREKNDK